MSARSHGISCTSFLVYSPDLPIQVTIAFLDFVVFGQLVSLYPPYIRFLFVEPRFRYVFLSPPLTEVSFDSRYRVHRQQVPQGEFHPRCTTCPSYQIRASCGPLIYINCFCICIVIDIRYCFLINPSIEPFIIVRNQNT